MKRTTRQYIISMADLSVYAETEAGLNVQWNSDRTKGMCLCPFHGDSNRSLSIRKHEDGWGFVCFGCNVRGTIIEFVEAFKSIDTEEAAKEICRFFNIENVHDTELAVAAFKRSGQRKQASGKEIAEANRRISDRGRTLMRAYPDNDVLKNEVFGIYARANACMEKGDLEGLDLLLLEVGGIENEYGRKS